MQEIKTRDHHYTDIIFDLLVLHFPMLHFQSTLVTLDSIRWQRRRRLVTVCWQLSLAQPSQCDIVMNGVSTIASILTRRARYTFGLNLPCEAR